KVGMRASETAEIIFDNCRIPADQVLGEVGEGFIQSMKILDGGRISIGALSLGIGNGAYKAAKQYAKEREQFGKPISKFQAIAFKLAEMGTELRAAEHLVRDAGRLKDAGEKCTLESAMAKYHASETCVAVATDAVQIFGGYGYIKDYPAEKFWRDSKLCTIGEGTTEIQKLVISRELMRE
ncbi:MAG: acyl-CoA dehydrogenase family protein, partial [Bacteroidota bacterium]